MSASDPIVRINAIIEENARLLREDGPTIGVHVLADGRVRVYDLGLGWRRRGYCQYRTAERALEAATIANQRAHKAADLMARGMSAHAAVAEARR